MTNALDADESTNAELDETVVLRRWRQLAAVAFSVESAHRSGATHGAIHAGNLAVDHQGKVCVLDATSSITALERWLGKNSTGIQCLENRIQFDVDDFVSLVCETEKSMHSMTSEQLVQDVRNTASNHQQSQLACIGEVLMRYADHHQGLSIEQQPRWRARISRWWLGKN
jgi:predicted unusual protein kinase regulating ubiquinone biosynthesis (AarF/ABC1/UbiB family)